MQAKRCKGILRNKFQHFTDKKSELGHRRSKPIPKGSRFSRSNLGLTSQGQNPIELIELATMRKPFIEDAAESTSNTISNAKPLWVTHYEQCEFYIRKVEDIRKQMLLCQSRRLACLKVSEEKEYEAKIYEHAKNATSKIRQAEKLVNIIEKDGHHSNDSNQQVCKSICLKLASEIRQSAKKLRSQQKSFIDQKRQFDETTKVSFLDVAADHVLSHPDEFFDYEQIQDNQEIMSLQNRNEEITKIVESIVELNEVYKDMNDMVILQGSLLDRIDYNIDEAHQATAKGTETLVKVEKRHKSSNNCACKTIVVLLAATAVFFIILIYRWSRR